MFDLFPRSQPHVGSASHLPLWTKPYACHYQQTPTCHNSVYYNSSALSTSAETSMLKNTYLSSIKYCIPSLRFINSRPFLASLSVPALPRRRRTHSLTFWRGAKSDDLTRGNSAGPDVGEVGLSSTPRTFRARSLAPDHVWKSCA